ncbi:MAG: Flp family type IVb pilin [Gemmataceae bacterium]
MLIRTKQRQRRKGQALIEYSLLVAGIALVCVLAVAVLGHKTSDAIGIMAAIMPGAHAEDNAPIKHQEGVLPTTTDADGNIILDSTAMVAPGGLDRYQGLLGPGGAENLIVD